MTANPTVEDFSLFVLVYLASVDGSIHPTEEDIIHNKIKKLFPHLEITEEKVLQAGNLIKSKGKDLSEKWIKENLRTLSSLTAEQKQNLFVNLFDIINADGHVKEEETRILRMLRAFFNPS